MLDLRMSGVYWSVTALSLLLPADQVMEEMRVFENNQKHGDDDDKKKQQSLSLVDWIFTCFDTKAGGFGGNTGQDAHLLYTLSALQILALADRLAGDDRLPRDRVIQFIASLQQPDGSFCGDAWGEIDTRFTYCALQSLALLNALEAVNVHAAATYIVACRNLDGGFGCVPGAESHAGQVFCCVGALAIAQKLDLLTAHQVDLLGWWLCERQVDSGGLNGRPEKQADVCYSWWILSTMSILAKVSWINGDKLASFILKCQDEDDGGIADRPSDMPDVYHTFFGIAGLSLLGHLHKNGESARVYRQIDPIYALPTDVVQRLQLPGQVVQESPETPIDERLTIYKIHVPSSE